MNDEPDNNHHAPDDPPPNPPEQWQPEIRQHNLTHHKARPAPVDGIIIHSMGQYIGDDFAGGFLEKIGLSAHYLVGPDGVVYECVDPARQAYHAGVSSFEGQENLNSTFVGIEILVKGHHNYASFLEAIKKPESFSDEHYRSTAWICNKLVRDYLVPLTRIRRHSDVSGVDVRPNDPKKDPGEGFDFQRLLNLIEA